jgi:hypothetical protein
MGIEFNGHAGRHREGLMHGAAMCHLEEPLALRSRDAMREVNRECNPAYPMRLFRHGPLCFDAQPFGRDLMAVAVASRKIADSAGE